MCRTIIENKPEVDFDERRHPTMNRRLHTDGPYSNQAIQVCTAAPAQADGGLWMSLLITKTDYGEQSFV